MNKKNIKNSRKFVKPKQPGYTIGKTLMLGLFVAIIAIMAVTLIISVVMVKSVQTSDKIEFYDNAFEISIKNFYAKKQMKEETAEYRKEFSIKEVVNSNDDLLKIKSDINNRLLMMKYFVKDIFIVDINNRLLYTTLKQGEYSYTPNEMTPLNITKYQDYTLIPLQKIFMKDSYYSHSQEVDKDNSYIVYLSVPKMTSSYVNQIFIQLGVFFIIVLIICMLCMSLLVGSIIKPLNTMEKTISEITQGKLSGRLELTKYEEINKLVWAYNMMAEALQRLYSSLEAQVNDQTKELKSAYAELKSTQAMMVHSEKMKSLGELVAGIMHEINNPINFIYGNMTHLKNYSNDLIEIIDEYTKFESSLKPSEKNIVIQKKTDCDYEFLKTDMPDLIKSCKEGAERAKNIIQDLKSFSRMEEVSIRDVDIPSEIDTVLNILHNKIKNKAMVHKEYMKNIPTVEAFGGQLNQVFMNILDNAVGAIEKNGDIWIRINTDESKKDIIIEIEDNGAGMDEETQKKVFDPFFTTKPVGQGTGLGMSITYKIIKNHQGDIKVESTKGKGTKFIIKLPLNIDKESLKMSLTNGES